jgi:DNA anti-recombination protein RmuC
MSKASPTTREAAMAQGPMDHDRISNVERALDEHKELTREQFREILRRLDAEQTRRETDSRELRALIETRFAESNHRFDESQRHIDQTFARSETRNDALHAEGRRRFDDAMARIDRKFDRLTALLLTSWLTTMGTLLYLHFR